jgi:outer membrane protein
MKTTIKLLTAALLLCMMNVSGQQSADSMKLSLVQAQVYAIENSASVRSALLDLETAKKKVLETTAIGLPQANASASYSNIFNVPELNFGGGYNFNLLPDGAVTKSDLLGTYVEGQPIPLGVQQNVTVNATVSWLLFSGEYIVGLQSSRIYKEFSEQSLLKSKNDTRETVARAYYLVLSGRESLRIMKENRDITVKLLSDLTAMNKQGFNEETDVMQSQLNKQNLDNVVTMLEGQVRVFERLLKFQMGMDLDAPILLTDSIGTFTADIDKESFLAKTFNVEDNIDYKIMETTEHLSMMSLKREKSKYLPTLSSFYQHQELMKQPKFNFSYPNMIGATLSVPIFSSGSRYAKVKQAQFQLEKAQIGRKQVGQVLMVDFEQSRNSYMTAINNYDRLVKNLGLAKSIYDKTMIKYKAGMASSMEITQAQNQYLSVQTSYYASVLEFLNAKAKIEKLLETNN